MRSTLLMLGVLSSATIGAGATPVGTAPETPAAHVALFVSGRVLADCDPGCTDTLSIAGGEPVTRITLPLVPGLDGAYQLDAGLPLALTPGSYVATLEIKRIDDGSGSEVDPFTSVLGSCRTAFATDASGQSLRLEVVRSGFVCLMAVVPDTPAASPGPDPFVPGLPSLHRLPPSLDPLITPVGHAVSLAPTSHAGLVRGQPFAFTLGHCGLGSPVDVGGSLWDPLAGVDAQGGPLDSDAEIGELINSTPGQAALVDADRLDLHTPTGALVVFARHIGSQFYPMCE